MGDYICVFDCETVPDTDALRRVYGYEGSDIEVAKQAFKAQKEASGNEFLPICFHKVVCISAVMADGFGRFLRVSTIEGENEEQIIAKFIDFINAKNPRLISFNGRGFDLPMLMVRAMRYNLCAYEYFAINDKAHGKDRWTNYRSRYDGVFHLDLLDHMSDFGSVRGVKMDHLCASFGLPGKYDVSGNQVFELYFNGDMAKIDEYCQSDTLNTYWLFLKYELLRGNINLSDYANYLGSMMEYLDKERADMGYTSVFNEAIKAELEKINNA